VRYSHVVAADIASADGIAAIFGFSAHVQPLQIDLLHLLHQSPSERSPEALTQLALTQLLSNRVAAIYHVAGCVDTRESAAIRRRLFDVNSRVTSALAALASHCGVERFVYVSSASVLHSKLSAADAHIPCYFRLLPRPSMLSRRCSASVPSSYFSSYSASKLEGERNLLQVIDSSSGMRACILRPHVIWGRHDPLSTEMLLSWPRGLPLVLIGDIDSRIIAVRADSVAQYAFHPIMLLLLQCCKFNPT
jgi:nucleoside-diphosphate-sugar epimerase